VSIALINQEYSKILANSRLFFLIIANL